TLGEYRGELNFQIVQCTDIYNLKFVIDCYNCSNSEYLDQCYDSENCFGCVGLRKKKFCILNKQYTPEEYEALKDTIIAGLKAKGEYGKFLPPEFAYNGYNATLANMYYPLSESEAKEAGYKWEHDEPSTVAVKLASEIPDDINAVSDDILKLAFACEKSGRAFKFVSQELAFHRKYQIPLSHVHPDTRDRERFKFITAIKPRTGTCDLCHEPITHYFPADWGFKKILCAKCYEESVL
ncbi:MAG: hypothetical protein V1821_04370, partial [bacterium]